MSASNCCLMRRLTVLKHCAGNGRRSARVFRKGRGGVWAPPPDYGKRISTVCFRASSVDVCRGRSFFRIVVQCAFRTRFARGFLFGCQTRASVAHLLVWFGFAGCNERIDAHCVTVSILCVLQVQDARIVYDPRTQVQCAVDMRR